MVTSTTLQIKILHTKEIICLLNIMDCYKYNYPKV